MDKKENRFNVEQHTTLDNKIIDVFPISHRYIHDLEQQVKKQKEVIDKVNNHIKNKLQKSDAYEMGLKNSSYKDRLYSETYIELQVVLNILKEVSE